MHSVGQQNQEQVLVRVDPKCSAGESCVVKGARPEAWIALSRVLPTEALSVGPVQNPFQS
jgi:hypothetical protein